MCRVLSAIAVAVWLVLAAPGSVRAQGVPATGFRNATNRGIIVQGSTVIKGMQRAGQVLIIRPGRTGFDNLPCVTNRVYTIYDANQPSRVLLRGFPVPAGRSGIFVIRPSPINPAGIIIGIGP